MALIESAQIYSFVDSITIWVYIIIGLIVFGIIFFFVWIKKAYDIDVEVIDLRGNGKRILPTKARRKREGGFLYFKIWRSATLLKPPTDSSLIYSKNGKDHIKLYKYSETEYAYVKIDDKDFKYTPIDSDIKLWFFMNMRRLNELYKKGGFWAQYGTYVIQLAMCLVFFLICFFLLKEIGHIADVAASVQSSCANAQVIGGTTPPA